MAVVYELNRQHQKHGGHAQVVVGRGTRHDYAFADCIEVGYPLLPNPRQKLIDTVLARLNLPRGLESSIYRPASRAIARDFDGPIFVINAPGALPIFRRRHRRAQVCLYAVNALFRTYHQTEVRRTLRSADRVICCSDFIANDLEMRLGKGSPKIHVVHNGVDVDKFQPLSRAQSPGEGASQAEVPTILFVGRAVPEKGPDLLLRAACKIHRARGGKGRPFKVRIVGSAGFEQKRRLSPYEMELRRIAAPLGESVEFQPSVDREQLLREYQAASIFCAPSNWDDPFPLTVLEAMSCALPVVASRRGGIPESGGEDIFYFQPPEVDELASHLADLVDSPSLRAEWGARARARVQKFAWRNQYLTLRRALDLAPSLATTGLSEPALNLFSSLDGLGLLTLAGWII